MTATWTHDPAHDYVPAKYRRACRYEAFVPERIAGWAPSLGGELAGIVADAQHAVASLEADGSPWLAPLARLLLRTEAVASSKIEGMQVGAREFARAEARHDLGGRVGPEARAILAGVDSMQFAIEQASAGDAALTGDSILEIHRLLMANAPGWTTPGRYREHQNWIGGNDFNPCGADFVPPPADDVQPFMDDLVEACQDDSLPAVVQAAIIHAQFETIHPFNDGNGRVGRSLIHVVLRRRGLVGSFVPPVSVLLARRREQYIDALTRFRAGDAETWIEMFAVSLAQSVTVASRYLDQVRALQERWHEQVEALGTRHRADAAVWVLLRALPAHPVLSGPAAVAASGRSKPAINQAISQLVDAGVLIPLSSGARNRTWEAAGLLDLVEQVDSGG